MRADNSRHVIAAARRRAEQTRQRAIAALRRMDATGQRITFDAVSRASWRLRSWLYAQDDLRAQIEQLRQRHPAAPRPRFLLSGNGPPIPRLRRLEAATRPHPPSGSRQPATPRRPRPGAGRTPGPPTCSARPVAATRRRTTHRKSSDRAESHFAQPVDNTVLIASPQVKVMTESRSQDNGRKRHIAVDAIGLLLAVVITAALSPGPRRGPGRCWNLRPRLRPQVWLAWADGGYAGKLAAWARPTLEASDCADRRASAGAARLRGPAPPLGRRAARCAWISRAPALRPRLRAPARKPRSHGLVGHDRPHDPAPRRRAPKPE